MISGTITDASGRTLSGQTAEAFWYSLRHAQPLSIGLNCALGAKDLRAHVDVLAQVADAYVSTHPNAGLPNAFGGYDETPGGHGRHAARIRRRPACSTWSAAAAAPRRRTSRAIAAAVADVPPRRVPQLEEAPDDRALPRQTRLSGLEPLQITPQSNFVNVGERTNVTGSAQFKKLILEGRFDEAVVVARQQVESGAQVIDVNMDEGMLDSEQAMVTYLT